MNNSGYKPAPSAHEGILMKIDSLCDKDFNRLSDYITSSFGIKMPAVKKTMLESRLLKRLRRLKLTSYKDYCDYLFSPEGMESEIPHFINKVTTNKTDFYREPEHFSYLIQAVLPKLAGERGGLLRNLRIWSAGCSTGEEPYTLAIVLKEFAEKHPQYQLGFSILATDISEEALITGHRAVYDESKIDPIPLHIKKKFLMKSKIRESGLVKIAPEIRDHVEFSRLNLMDKDFRFSKKMDIVFCRNVIIYFDRETQEAILNRVCRHIISGGYFFQGHSESIQGMNLPLRSVHPTIFEKTI